MGFLGQTLNRSPDTQVVEQLLPELAKRSRAFNSSIMSINELLLFLDAERFGATACDNIRRVGPQGWYRFRPEDDDEEETNESTSEDGEDDDSHGESETTRRGTRKNKANPGGPHRLVAFFGQTGACLFDRLCRSLGPSL